VSVDAEADAGVGTARDERRAQLEEERDFLLRSLDDLDLELAAGDLAPTDFTRLHDDYTARAAVVLRRLQAIDAAPERPVGETPAPAATTPRPTARSRRPIVLGVVVTVLLAGVAGWLVTRSSGERLPGQEVSGGPSQSSAAQLQQAIQLDQGNQLTAAAKLYDAVLKADPGNVVALTNKGWILGRSGKLSGNVELLNDALPYLERAERADPTFADAHVFRGLVLGALGRPGDAGCELRLYLSLAPPDEPQNAAVQAALDEATKQAGGTLPACPAAPTPKPATGP
jgi:tetratricopeptide (TPR) repeat protein